MSSLSDFGGGYEPDTANPEDEVNKTLSQWLASQANTRVYWDRNRSYGHGTFSASTHPQRPDLLIDTDGGTYVVEVKRGNKTGSLYEAAEQLIGYWSDIVTGDATYRCRGEDIDIDAVVLATQFSPEGHVFHNNRGLDPRRGGRSSDSDVAGEQYPTVEHAASQAYTRTVYRWARWYCNNHNIEAETGIGALYSSALDGDGSGAQDATPAVFYLVPNAGRATQNWSYIPYWKQNDE